MNRKTTILTAALVASLALGGNAFAASELRIGMRDDPGSLDPATNATFVGRVSLQSICDKLVIHGTPDSVADQLLAFQDEVGEFGTLLYAGKDWTDPKLGRDSMILMAEKVMPQVNAAATKRASAAE